ncbi:MAG: helix-turn-helix transcriptional regulator [Bacteroidota bacterium]
MRPILWLHFVPAFLMFLNTWPELTAEVAEKVANQRRFATEGTVRDYTWIWLLKVIHSYIYFGLSIQLILLYRKHLSDAASNIDTAFHRWLLTFIFILALPLLGLLAFVFTTFTQLSLMTLALGALAFLVAIYVATLFKPELFHAFPHQMPIPSSSESQKQKYEHSNLQPAQKEKYLVKLKNYMAQEKPFQLPELTLAQLAEKVNIPSYYLSQVINEKLNCNFLDFVNGYRIELAKELLLNPKFEHYTIVSIAYEADFNSKSTFYSAFKKMVGMTPSQFRKGQVVVS